MSKIKKLLSVILTAVMVLAMSIPTFANTNLIGDRDDTAKIEVTNVGAATSVKAYPIILAKYQDPVSNQDSIFTGYDVMYSTNPAITVDDNGDYQLSEDQIAQIRAQISTNTTEGTALENKGNGTWSKELPIGAYLIVVEGEETATYNAMVASTNYKKDVNGNTVINIDKATAIAKKTTAPDLEKKIIETKEGTETKVNGNTANIGDTVEYEVTVKNIPNYTGKYPVFNVEDTLSEGLTYNDDVKVSVKDETNDTSYGLTKDTYYKDTSEGQTIKLNFVDDSFKSLEPKNGYSLAAYHGKTLVIRYSATVNEKARLNNVGNNNDAKVTFSKDSSVDNKVGEDEDKTYTYTFDIDGNAEGSVTEKLITKVGTVAGKTETAPLENAEFTLYTDADCKTPYTNKVWNNGKVRSDKDGQMQMTGLKAGTYYLKETAAPDGYTLNNTVYTIEIAETLNEDGTLKTWTISINGATIIDGNGNQTKAENVFTVTSNGVNKTEVAPVDIINTKISSLPSTGGIGTTIFTIGGCAIMIVAAGLFFATRRKTQK